MTRDKLQSRFQQIEQLAQVIAADAQQMADMQHEPHAAEALRSISDGAQFLEFHSKELQQALGRL